ncbi:nucleotide exchange factor GrpE [Arthrospira platensis]|uniref:nucleotide exchange factor GrpE n=2 Tax=Sirenicapillariaceae TaxID=2934961 RepID=UPI0001C3859F|nr:nucleotide exchange factor GrpE [Arthrospira platensis]MDT9182377.1 nucleotide exchange factor GrpE [Limnospira sp. PMC 289.06]MDT9310123.1 nucleotide exchange factor GrpE [Limnospira sp. Paracas R14]QQW29100.2 nucleotide exchange factor GrpE [Arthrospira sp. PCC 9108]
MMNDSNKLEITAKFRDELQTIIGQLFKEKTLMQQELMEKEQEENARLETLFLEFLEVVDSLDFLIEYLHNNPEPDPKAIARFPQLIATIQKKLLNTLEKREVITIDFQGKKPDFEVCKIIDREVNGDLENETITKIVRRGFQYGDRLLRPVEVIVSKSE